MITINATSELATGLSSQICPVNSSDSPQTALNDTQMEFPADKCIHELIAEQVARTPDATAVVFENTRLTYSELDRRANDLATRLQDFGVGPDVPVGLHVERSVEMVIGMLAILKAGGCYLPLDPTYPNERLSFLLNDARPPVLLTQTSLRDELVAETPGLKRLFLDQINSRFELPENKSAPSNLAYLIYTSGSTGKPKGVMIAHRNVVNFFSAMDRVLGTEPGVWLAVTSISFDISVLELLWTLARGFTVVIRPEALRSTDVSIPEHIFHHGVTHLQCTPSLAGTFVRSPGVSGALRRLRKLLVGGEALPATLAAQLRPYLSGELINMYGPTETTVWSATHCVGEEVGTVPIGRPIGNTQIYILDEQRRPIADGEAGEIFIGGEGVARGYFNRPELTAEKFIRDPFSHEATARLYRTGDVGRLRHDGEIEFLGRVDHQIKLNGHRIELGEIEAALRQHGAVRECVVHAWEFEPGDKRLAAYIVPVSPSDALAIELRRFLEPTLPGYMIPAAFVWLKQMPLTPNGKTDRNALPKPGEVRPKLNPAYLAPQNEIEETIAGIWRQVLRVEKIGVHDNFFDLGGNSLLLMETHAKLCLTLKADVPIVRYFEHPTIGALAEFLRSRQQDSFTHLRERAERQRQAFASRTPTSLNL